MSTTKGRTRVTAGETGSSIFLHISLQLKFFMVLKQTHTLYHSDAEKQFRGKNVIREAAKWTF